MIESFLDWAESHVRLFQFIAATFAILSFFLGFAWGHLSAFRRWRREVREYREMENPGVVVVEAHVLKNVRVGIISLDVVSWGGKYTLSELLHDPILEKKVEKAARQREGFICLEPPDQLLLMDALQEILTGNDHAANLDSIRGRPVHINEVVMCPISWRGLRAAHLIRLVVIDAKWTDALLRGETLIRIHATRARYQHRTDWLQQIAERWQTEKNKDVEEACMRLVRIESQKVT